MIDLGKFTLGKERPEVILGLNWRDLLFKRKG